MTLKREIKDAYIENGDSVYIKTHGDAVYVDENETETLTQRLDNVKNSIAEHTSQLDAIANNTLQTKTLKGYAIQFTQNSDFDVTMLRTDLLNKIKASNEYSFSSINKFMISLLSNNKEVKISSILDKLKEIESSSVKLLLGLLYQYNDLASYTIIKLDDEVIIDNYRLMNFIIRGKNNG